MFSIKNLLVLINKPSNIPLEQKKLMINNLFNRENTINEP